MVLERHLRSEIHSHFFHVVINCETNLLLDLNIAIATHRKRVFSSP